METEAVSMMETAIRWAVEARGERKGTEEEQTTEQEQGKNVRCREEEQSEDASAEYRRAGCDEWLCGGENKQRKCRSHPRER